MKKKIKKAKYNIGDTVYYIEDYKIKKLKIRQISSDNDNIVRYYSRPQYIIFCNGIKENELYSGLNKRKIKIWQKELDQLKRIHEGYSQELRKKEKKINKKLEKIKKTAELTLWKK